MPSPPQLCLNRPFPPFPLLPRLPRLLLSLLIQLILHKNKRQRTAAARHGSRHLDRAVCYLLDSDADRCADPIWLLGVSILGMGGAGATDGRIEAFAAA
jgi:hypothetical protein